MKLRLCRPGELGSIMSNYVNIGENQSYEWNIVPLNIYLYGVEDSRDRPLVAFQRVVSNRPAVVARRLSGPQPASPDVLDIFGPRLSRSPPAFVPAEMAVESRLHVPEILPSYLLLTLILVLLRYFVRLPLAFLSFFRGFARARL